MKISKIVCVVAMLASSVFAHQFFPMQTANGYEVGFWADDHWGQYQPNNIFGVKAFDNNAKSIKAGYDYQNAKIFVDGKPALMTINYDFGYYTFTADGKHYATKRNQITDVNGANVVVETRKIWKSGKSIFEWNDKFKKPLGLKMEIVPLQNPLLLKAGDELKVQVFYMGKPIAGVEFEDQNDDIDNITTDSKGMATLKLTKPQGNLQIIAATIKFHNNQDRFADTLQQTATLSFKSK